MNSVTITLEMCYRMRDSTLEVKPGPNITVICYSSTRFQYTNKVTRGSSTMFS